MCTAITFHAESDFFGRNLDLDERYDESITIIPRSYPLSYRSFGTVQSHLAIIGMATVIDGYPLFYDGANECGISIAGLNFTHSCKYSAHTSNRINIASFEFIPYILSTCSTMAEVKDTICAVNLTNEHFRDGITPAYLHYIIADRSEAITVEPTNEGIKIYDNPYGILTNEPPFPFHREYVKGFSALSNKEPTANILSEKEALPYSFGMGAIGLPGDYSSASRFVRALYLKRTAYRPHGISASLNQGFKILSGVSVPEGAVLMNGKFERTQYTSLIDQRRLIYYLRSYENPSTLAVRLSGIEGDELISYNIPWEESIRYLN